MDEGVRLYIRNSTSVKFSRVSNVVTVLPDSTTMQMEVCEVGSANGISDKSTEFAELGPKYGLAKIVLGRLCGLLCSSRFPSSCLGALSFLFLS